MLALLMTNDITESNAHSSLLSYCLIGYANTYITPNHIPKLKVTW